MFLKRFYILKTKGFQSKTNYSFLKYPNRKWSRFQTLPSTKIRSTVQPNCRTVEKSLNQHYLSNDALNSITAWKKTNSNDFSSSGSTILVGQRCHGLRCYLRTETIAGKMIFQTNFLAGLSTAVYTHCMPEAMTCSSCQLWMLAKLVPWDSQWYFACSQFILSEVWDFSFIYTE